MKRGVCGTGTSMTYVDDRNDRLRSENGDRHDAKSNEGTLGRRKVTGV